MRRGAQLAGLVFLATWIPASLWKGLSLGRAFRIGSHGQGAVSPLIDGVVQAAFAMLAPAMFAALMVFVLWMWRHEPK